MESAVQLPQYVVFDLSAGTGLRCFGPVPAMEHVGVPFHGQALGLEALHRARLSRADVDVAAAHRLVRQASTAMNSCDRHVQISDPDTVSDAGTSGIQVAEESEDEADSFDAVFFQESFAMKIDALAQLVGMKGAYKPAAVLGEVVRVLQAADRRECSERATMAL
ncbi:hypothetical protein HU200_036886 [Digitaria exilis]|uniref:Uncharacterized protein n=1 Tax=Digitaria exilis TaxID=1010633 RepID=A0A835BF63_9POAL|nr:hypothetical protein HU200_036886 [Digitaria exilis]